MKTKPFGYVLKSKTQSNFPWLNTRSWVDASYSIGNMRAYLGDATVFKRRSTAERYPHMEIVAVYSDPRKTGSKALIAA